MTIKTTDERIDHIITECAKACAHDAAQEGADATYTIGHGDVGYLEDVLGRKATHEEVDALALAVRSALS